MKHRLKSLIIVVAALCLLTGQALFAMDSVDNDLSELMAEIQDATNKGDSPATSPCISPVSSRPASPSQEQPILNEQAFAGALSNKPTPVSYTHLTLPTIYSV